MLTRKSTATRAEAHTTQERHAESTKNNTRSTSKNKSKVTARRGHTRLKLGEGPPGCLGSAGEGRMHAKPGTRLSSDGAATPSPPHKHTHSHKHIHGTAKREQRREQLDAKKMPNKKKPNRLYMPAECGGVTTPPLLSIALRPCRHHAGSQHWSHRSRPGGAGAIACASCMIGRAQDARGRAHERRWGEVWLSLIHI